MAVVDYIERLAVMHRDVWIQWNRWVKTGGLRGSHFILISEVFWNNPNLQQFPINEVFFTLPNPVLLRGSHKDHRMRRFCSFPMWPGHFMPTSRGFYRQCKPGDHCIWWWKINPKGCSQWWYSMLFGDVYGRYIIHAQQTIIIHSRSLLHVKHHLDSLFRHRGSVSSDIDSGWEWNEQNLWRKAGK